MTKDRDNDVGSDTRYDNRAGGDADNGVVKHSGVFCYYTSKIAELLKSRKLLSGTWEPAYKNRHSGGCENID